MRTGPERGEVVSIFGQAASNSGVDQLGEGSVRFGGLHPKGLMQGWFKIDCGTFGIGHGHECSVLTLRRQDVITLLACTRPNTALEPSAPVKSTSAAAQCWTLAGDPHLCDYNLLGHLNNDRRLP